MELLKQFAILALLVSFGNAVKTLPACDFPAIYNFGDSNSDTGGISAAFEPISAPYSAGRDSDGRLIIDFIAEHLKLPYLSAYLNSIGTDFRHGANFATGGSTIRRPNETIYQYGISPFFLGMQIIQFNQFKARTTDLYNRAKGEIERSKLPRPMEFSRALYTFDIGQNDLSVGFRTMSNEQLSQAMPDIVNQLATAVQHLYEQGGRSFWIHNTGPIGCLPVMTFYVRNPKPGFLDQYGCIKGQNDAAIEFNKQLKLRLSSLRTQLPEAAITYVDVYSAKYKLISTTKNRGFAEPLKVCCGIHENDINVWCGQKNIINGSEMYGGVCKDPSKHISWDGVHYSHAANGWVFKRTLNGSLSDPPRSLSQSCYKTV